LALGPSPISPNLTNGPDPLAMDMSFFALRLAIGKPFDDIGAGRLVVDEPLANRVRSGRKQP
jgi:hypothetical protein